MKPVVSYPELPAGTKIIFLHENGNKYPGEVIRQCNKSVFVHVLDEVRPDGRRANFHHTDEIGCTVMVNKEIELFND